MSRWFGATGNMVRSSSLVVPRLLCVVIWEYVEINVLLFSPCKDFLYFRSSGSMLPGCGWSAGLELDAELHHRFPVWCWARLNLSLLCPSSVWSSNIFVKVNLWPGVAKGLGHITMGTLIQALAFVGGSGERSLCRQPAGILGNPERSLFLWAGYG